MFQHQGVIFKELPLQKGTSTNTSIWYYNIAYKISKIIKYKMVKYKNHEVVDPELLQHLKGPGQIPLSTSYAVHAYTHLTWSSTIHKSPVPVVCRCISHQVVKSAFSYIYSYIPYNLESNPYPFYSFRGLKTQMRIRFAVESWILEK